MLTPEQLARQSIDDLLAQCGWIVQSRNEMNLGAARSNAGEFFGKGGLIKARQVFGVELPALLDELNVALT
jgi:hypothetical protein